MKQTTILFMLWGISLCIEAGSPKLPIMNRDFNDFTLDYDTPVNVAFQAKVERIDADLREQFEMTTNQTEVGLLDLTTLRLALIHPDREEYAAACLKSAFSWPTSNCIPKQPRT